MATSIVRRRAGVFCVATLVASIGWSAEQTGKASTTSASRSAASRSSSGKGPLPDPTLLDGSTQPAEKKSEHGMIGDFELPGDENARSGKVGGPPGQPGGQGQGQQPPGVSVSLPIPALPGARGGAGAPPAGGGLNLPTLPDPTKQSAGGGQGAAGESSPNAGGAPGGTQSQGGSAGNEIAKPDGIQVGGLQGPGGAGADSNAGASAKPSAVSIGDSAMRIEPSSNPAAAGGQNQQIAGQTQQHEKGTGSGGKGSGGATSGNRVEKGRVIPSGL